MDILLFFLFLVTSFLFAIALRSLYFQYKTAAAKYYYVRHKYDKLSPEFLDIAIARSYQLGLSKEFKRLLERVELQEGKENLRYGHITWIFDQLLDNSLEDKRNSIIPHYFCIKF